MPVYTYRCDNCGIQFDQRLSFDDPPLTRCPECNKKTLHKVYSPVGIVFKGSGFYATDHRSPSGVTHATPEKDKEKPADKPVEKTKAVKKESDSSSTATPSKEKKD